jgi:ATP-binding cassette subfamily F protein 3
VLWIEAGAWGVVDGGYDGYETGARERERNALERKIAPPREKTSQFTPLKMRSRLQTQVGKLEREIERLDARKGEIEALFADPALYADAARVRALEAECQRLGERSAQAVLEWETALTELEDLS